MTDTGPGIAEEELKMLFASFVQTKTGRQAQEGTGLGLVISRGFVQLLGGEMHLESRPGEGTMVRFDLPVGIVDASALKVAGESRQAVALAPNQPRYRILVADDRATMRQLHLRLLAPMGFEIREAENGQQAIDMWRAWQPHLILMDLRMPVVDGYAATRQIKSTPQGQATKIIAVTTSGFEEEGSEVLASGCDDFLRKPFREEDLIELLRKHLGVRFLDQAELPRATLTEQPKVDSAQLAALPAILLAELEHAVVQLDVRSLHDVIETMRGHDARLAEGLAELAQDFQYDRIWRLVQRTGRQSTTRPENE